MLTDDGVFFGTEVSPDGWIADVLADSECAFPIYTDLHCDNPRKDYEWVVVTNKIVIHNVQYECPVLVWAANVERYSNVVFVEKETGVYHFAPNQEPEIVQMRQ